MKRVDKNSPIPGATNTRYIHFVSVSAINKCQNWRFLDFIAQMHGMYNGRTPIQSQEEFNRFIENNKGKYKEAIYE